MKKDISPRLRRVLDQLSSVIPFEKSPTRPHTANINDRDRDSTTSTKATGKPSAKR